MSFELHTLYLFDNVVVTRVQGEAGYECQRQQLCYHTSKCGITSLQHDQKEPLIPYLKLTGCS